MDDLFTKDYFLLWAVVLAAALYYPVRQLIWVLYVRRTESQKGKTDERERDRLKRRAGITSALLCFVFAILYTSYLFRDRP